MKKTVLLCFVALAFANSVFAAKFEKIPAMKSVSARILAAVASKMARNQDVFGDASYVHAFSFTGGEEVVPSMEQLNRGSKVNLMQGKSAVVLAGHLLENLSQPDDDQEQAVAKARVDLEKAFRAVKADKSLKIYGASYGNEDGSWQILDILDTTNSEVLFIKIGYSGT